MVTLKMAFFDACLAQGNCKDYCREIMQYKIIALAVSLFQRGNKAI